MKKKIESYVSEIIKILNGLSIGEAEFVLGCVKQNLKSISIVTPLGNLSNFLREEANRSYEKLDGLQPVNMDGMHLNRRFINLDFSPDEIKNLIEELKKIESGNCSSQEKMSLDESTCKLSLSLEKTNLFIKKEFGLNGDVPVMTIIALSSLLSEEQSTRLNEILKEKDNI